MCIYAQITKEHSYNQTPEDAYPGKLLFAILGIYKPDLATS